MLANFVFLGAALAIILGIGQLIKPQHGNRNLLAAGLLLCLGLIHLYTFGQMADIVTNHPVLDGIQIPLFTLLGPLFYFYFMRVLDPLFNIERKHALHFLPTFLSFFAIIPYLLMSDAQKLQIHQGFMEGRASLWQTYPNNLVVLVFLLTLAYILYPVRAIWPLYKEGLLLSNRRMLIALSFIICFSLTIFCVVFYQFYDNAVLKNGVALFISAWVVAIYLTSQKYPQFLATVKSDIDQAKYKKSQLTNINTDSIIKRLEHLMEVDKTYLDPDLTLPGLAETLNLTSHQLSEILNKNLGISFKDYLKRYRIEEAKRLILEQPSQTILNISMDVGFRSLSTFNAAFRKEIGQTPVEYRNANLSKSPTS